MLNAVKFTLVWLYSLFVFCHKNIEESAVDGWYLKSNTDCFECPLKHCEEIVFRFPTLCFYFCFIFRSRKRRTSEHICTSSEDETETGETMTECSAAMLLMKLSCSPFTSQNSHHHHQVNQYINFNSKIMDFMVKTRREVKGRSRGPWPLKMAYPKCESSFELRNWN